MTQFSPRPHLDDTLKMLIGQTPRMIQLQRLIQKMGQSDWPVLILGETGTGKEVVARSIHQIKSNGPFVTVDCSSIVGPLMESELFGHTKGAFTGAMFTKAGLFEMAHGGTLFLDEIGELPLDLQAKLLRVLQEKEFRPVGGLTQKRANFRVLAATNRDLAEEVEKGRFRRDLYYRLNVVKLRLAPLRERIEDVPYLIEHFLERYRRGHVLGPDVMETLIRYDWPGNVRELENCIQRMIAVSCGPILGVDDLPSAVLNAVHHRPSQPLMKENIVAKPSPIQVEIEPGNETAVPHNVPEQNASILPLAEVERLAIIRALEFTNGDRYACARLLGIGRTTLYRKLKEYDLAAEQVEAASV